MTIDIVKDEGILIITNNDPATRNAINVDFYEGMAQAMASAVNDDEVGAVVVTGAGEFFCSGGNINRLRERLDMDEAGRREGVDLLHTMARAMRACPKPIVAAVEGGAAGAGLGLALACDLIVAAEDAYFAASYVKVGLTPDGGTTSYLSQSLPRQLVNEMALTAKPVTAARFHELGVVNELTAPGAALERATAWARELAQGPAASLESIKALTGTGQHFSLDAQLDAEAQFMTAALGGSEGREGITAFLAKRKPEFK